jgi:hypothetical protein
MPHGCKSLLFLNSNALKAPGLCEYHNRFQEGEWQNCAAYAEFSISGIMPSSRLCRLLSSPFLIHLLFQNVRFLIYPCRFGIIQLWTYPLYAIHRWWEMPIANSFTEGQIVLQWLRIRGRRLFPECPPRVKPPSNRPDYHSRSSRRSRLCRLELQRSQKGFALNAVSRHNPGVGIMPQCMSWH